MAIPVSVAEVECLEPGFSYDHYIQRGIRPNGRRVESARPLAITLAPLDSVGTVGSAFAIIGSTRVFCTATLQVGTPDLASPNEGDLVVKMSTASIANDSNLRQRQKTEKNQRLSENIRSTIIASGGLLLPDLCITEYRSAWELTLELMCLNDEGCLEDACLAAAMSTLRCVRLPATTTDDQGLVRLLPDTSLYTNLPVRRLLSCLTCRIWYPKPSREGDEDAMQDDTTPSDSPVVIVDPDHHEESLLKATVTVTYDASDSSAPVLCGVRARCGLVDPVIVAQCMAFASKRSVAVATALDKALKQL